MGNEYGIQTSSLKGWEPMFLFWAFDPISKLRDRPKYQLSADIHSHNAGSIFAYKSPYFLYDWDTFKSTTIGYA